MSTRRMAEMISDINPMGTDGFEFIEYTAPDPTQLAALFEKMGFRPVARHRSREVLLYRQGGMNIVINAHGGAEGAPPDEPVISAIGLRVRDAAAAYQRALERGAWGVPVQVAVMELHIPAIHGVGASRIYFVDRCDEFSIWDVDFVPIPTVERRPPALAGLHWFGVVQYIGERRMDDWCAFYRELFGFEALPPGRHFGILPRGRILRSPCGSFHLQLIEPEPGAPAGAEHLQRIGLGTPDVPAAAAALRGRGVEFVERGDLHSGALTAPRLGGVMVELVHDPRGA